MATGVVTQHAVGHVNMNSLLQDCHHDKKGALHFRESLHRSSCDQSYGTEQVFLVENYNKIKSLMINVLTNFLAVSGFTFSQ